jgi:hypothetical protein
LFFLIRAAAIPQQLVFQSRKRLRCAHLDVSGCRDGERWHRAMSGYGKHTGSVLPTADLDELCGKKKVSGKLHINIKQLKQFVTHLLDISDLTRHFGGSSIDLSVQSLDMHEL